MKTLNRGADTRVCRVETHLDAFRCWKSIPVSLKACFAALFLFAATAQAQWTVSVIPNSGNSPSGTAQTFTATYNDTFGYSDITAIYLDINTNPSAAGQACYVGWFSSDPNSLYLVNDAGTGWYGPLTLPSSNTKQNNQCTLSGAGSSISRSGTQAVMTVNLNFTAAFAGRKYLYMFASGTQGLSLPVQQIGSWTITSGSGGSDLASGKTATQSSTLPGYPTDVAAAAADGNTDGNFGDGSVTATNLDTNAWWQVDLGGSAAVSSVVIWNRTDCCQSRLSNYWTFISDTPFQPADTPATLQYRAGTWSNYQSAAPSSFATITASAFSPTGSPQGRYVRVQLSSQNYLSLAEVQVFGTIGGGCVNGAATMSTPANNSQLSGATATFNWTASCTATQYYLYLGTSQGANNLLSVGEGTSLTSGPLGLPASGSTLYVRLWSFIGGSWLFNDYTYPIGPSLPTITGISPTSGGIGTNVTITGGGFGASGTVTFNGTTAPIVSWSATSIVAQVPLGATTGIITVITGGYSVPYQQQQFQVTPVVVTVNPPIATLGQGQTTQFTATVTGTSTTGVTWSVPTGAGTITPAGLYTAPATITAQQTVTVTATSVAQTMGTATVTLIPPTPTITTLSLPSGPPQVGFTISGANFGATQGTGSVVLAGLPGGNRPLTVISWSTNGNSITVQVPAATPQGAGQVYVTTSGGATSSQVPFTVSPAFGCNF